jgi:hypothetical protein
MTSMPPDTPSNQEPTKRNQEILPPQNDPADLSEATIEDTAATLKEIIKTGIDNLRKRAEQLTTFLDPSSPEKERANLARLILWSKDFSEADKVKVVLSGMFSGSAEIRSDIEDCFEDYEKTPKLIAAELMKFLLHEDPEIRGFADSILKEDDFLLGRYSMKVEATSAQVSEFTNPVVCAEEKIRILKRIPHVKDSQLLEVGVHGLHSESAKLRSATLKLLIKNRRDPEVLKLAEKLSNSPKDYVREAAITLLDKCS